MTVCVAVGRYEQRHSLNREALAPVRKAGRSRVSRVANMDGDTVLALIDTHVSSAVDSFPAPLFMILIAFTVHRYCYCSCVS